MRDSLRLTRNISTCLCAKLSQTEAKPYLLYIISCFLRGQSRGLVRFSYDPTVHDGGVVTNIHPV